MVDLLAIMNSGDAGLQLRSYELCRLNSATIRFDELSITKLTQGGNSLILPADAAVNVEADALDCASLTVQAASTGSAGSSTIEVEYAITMRPGSEEEAGAGATVFFTRVQAAFDAAQSVSGTGAVTISPPLTTVQALAAGYPVPTIPDPNAGDDPDAGKHIGMAIGIPLGVIALGALVGLAVVVARNRRRTAASSGAAAVAAGGREWAGPRSPQRRSGAAPATALAGASNSAGADQRAPGPAAAALQAQVAANTAPAAAAASAAAQASVAQSLAGAVARSHSHSRAGSPKEALAASAAAGAPVGSLRSPMRAPLSVTTPASAAAPSSVLLSPNAAARGRAAHVPHEGGDHDAERGPQPTPSAAAGKAHAADSVASPLAASSRAAAEVRSPLAGGRPRNGKSTPRNAGEA